MGDSPNVDQSQDDLLDNDSELTEDGKTALKTMTSSLVTDRVIKAWVPGFVSPAVKSIFCQIFGIYLMILMKRFS